MKKVLFVIVLISINLLSATAQKELLKNGPMLGYSEMREVALWLQTTQPCNAVIYYWPKGNNKTKWATKSVDTKKETAYTAHFIADNVEPGFTYEYEVYLNKKKVILSYKTEFKTLPVWRWRGDPPAFKFVTGSCAYINEEQFDRPGKPYGSDYQIFTSINQQQPDFMLWLGDNVYYREADWNSYTGMHKRYTHSRAIQELQPLLASSHNYAIWDDHDFGPNDCDGSFWNKNNALEVFKLFWANPSYGVGDMKGVTTFFNWNDVDFFLLDNRWNRSANGLNANNKTILGREQIDWLKNALTGSNANFKIIAMGGQFLNDYAVWETYANNGFAAERAELIEFIQTENIKGVIFLTGDRHFTELSMLKRENYPPIYDLTTSSFTAGTSKPMKNEKNTLQVEGTVVTQHNFSVIDFSGTNAERLMTITVFDANGAELWKRSISVKDFETKK